MKINQEKNIAFYAVDMEGAKSVDMRVLIGPNDASDNIIMRQFAIQGQGHTPRHRHNYEHVVRVLSNHGVFIDEAGNEHPLAPGQSLYVAPNELHQFVNPNNEPFEFLCIIPNPAKIEA